MKRGALGFVLAVGVLMLLAAPTAWANPLPFTSILNLANCSSATSCLSGSTTGPYGTVVVDLTSSTTATITFNAASGFLFGGEDAADANISGTYTASNLTGNGSGTLSFTGSKSVDGFGSFSTTTKAFDGLTRASSTISFDITATGSTTWSSPSSVLEFNADGVDAAAHVFVTTPGTNFGLTGFAAEGRSTVPDGGVTVMLLGGALVGLEALRRRFAA